jgi:hypothetical protein
VDIWTFGLQRERETKGTMGQVPRVVDGV